MKHFISNLFGREPVVDNTREEDKYGNEGVVSQAIANTVVGGYEKISNAVNAAIEVCIYFIIKRNLTRLKFFKKKIHRKPSLDSSTSV